MPDVKYELEFYYRFNGTPIEDSWTGKEHFLYVPRNLPKGDTSSYEYTIPVFNAKAAGVLADLLEPNGELLPITCEGERLYLFNTTRFVDALDEENSECRRFEPLQSIL